MLMNIGHQVISLYDEINTTRIVIYSIYWIATIVSSIFSILSLYREKMEDMMYWSLVVFGFRNILRLFNFEEKEGSLIA